MVGVVGPIRAYPSISGRQEERATLVPDEATLRRNITKALALGKVPYLRQSKSFTLTKKLTIPAGLTGLVLEGAPGLEIRVAAGIDVAIDVAAAHVVLDGLTLRPLSGTPVAIEVSGGADHVSIRDCTFNAVTPAGGSSYFTSGVNVTGAVTAYLSVLRCVFQTQAGVLVESTASLSGGRVDSCAIKTASFSAADPFCEVGGNPIYVGNDSMSVLVEASSTTNGGLVANNTSCDVTIGANCGYVAISGNTGCSFDTSASNGFNRLAGNSLTGTRTLIDTDSDADCGSAQVHATLNAANPTITVDDAGLLFLNFGAGSSGNASLSNGVFTGHRLTLLCVSYAGSATLPDNTAQNVKLSAAWTPTADDTLSLIWDGSDWVELARSTN